MAEMDKSFWGIVDEAVLQRIVVVSPHFDDAVLGAAHLLGSYPRQHRHHSRRRSASVVPGRGNRLGRMRRVRGGR